MKVFEKIYPFVGNYKKINGLQYHYLDEGSGDPMIMVHGNPTWSIYYRNLVLAFSKNYRCIVPDHIGCGLSEKPDDSKYDYTLESRINDLEALILNLDLKNITLVVHDWGGAIGMGFAVKHPDLIKRIVVFNTAAFLMPKAKSLPSLLWFFRDTASGDWINRKFNMFSFIASHVACTKNKMNKDLRHAFRLPYDSWKNRIATSRFVQDIPLSEKDKSYKVLQDVQNNLYKLKEKPMLVCWGEKDFVFDEPILQEWLKYFPNSNLNRFKDSGHYILEDETSEIIDKMKIFFIENK